MSVLLAQGLGVLKRRLSDSRTLMRDQDEGIEGDVSPGCQAE